MRAAGADAAYDGDVDQDEGVFADEDGEEAEPCDDYEDDYEDDEEFLRGVPGLPPPPRTPPTVAGVPMPSGFAGGF